MYRILKYTFLTLILTIGFCLVEVCALEQDQDFNDTSAGVNVASVFLLSIDKNNIDFESGQPGQKQTLYEGDYFNQLICRSNHGKTWYLKAQLLMPVKHERGDIQIPPENFKWKVLSGNGDGAVANLYKFNGFSMSPELVYVSSGDDNLGKEVKLQLQYELDIPYNVLAGRYSSQILFTITETP